MIPIHWPPMSFYERPLKEELALLAYYSAPLLGRMWAKQLDAVLKQEAEERTVLRNEKLDAWFKGLPSPPV